MKNIFIISSLSVVLIGFQNCSNANVKFGAGETSASSEKQRAAEAVDAELVTCKGSQIFEFSDRIEKDSLEVQLRNAADGAITLEMKLTIADESGQTVLEVHESGALPAIQSVGPTAIRKFNSIRPEIAQLDLVFNPNPELGAKASANAGYTFRPLRSPAGGLRLEGPNGAPSASIPSSAVARRLDVLCE